MFSRRNFLLAITIPLLLALAGIAYLGSFTRLHADDFCIASSMNQLGFFPSIEHWYTSWAGRYMYLAAANLISLTGPFGAAVSPAIIILLMVLLLSWALLPVLRKAQWPHPIRVALAGSCLISLLLFSTTPSLFQSFFWRDGQVNYAFPIIGACLLVGLGARAWLEPTRTRAFYAVAMFALSLVTGGFAETYSATQVGVAAVCLGGILVFTTRETRSRIGWIFAAAFIGSLLAVALESIAPGNLVRLQQQSGNPVGLIQTIPLSLRSTLIFFRNLVFNNIFGVLLSLLVPFLAGWWLDSPTSFQTTSRNWRVLWAQPWFRGLILIPSGIFLVVAAACAPTAYIMGAYLADRSVADPLFFVLIGLVCWSAILGAGLHRLGFLPQISNRAALSQGIPVLMLAVVLIASGFSIAHTIEQAPDFRSYAASWDKRAAGLLDARRQGLAEITVYGLNSRFEISDLQVEPTFWVNRCMADYYGFANITGK